MINYARITALALGSLAATNGLAQGTYVGTVEFLQSGQGYSPEGAYSLVKISGARTNQPSCATEIRMALSPSTPQGAAFLSMLLFAHATGRTVHIFGTGDCAVMGNNYESISYLRVF